MMNRSGALVLLLLTLTLSASQAVERKNGFDLSNALVPVDEILPGGPPRDGIPSIDKPRFLEADKARDMKSNAQILGVVFNGVAKAYPIDIMNWHEIVNDDYRGVPVVVTFCPLCGTGMAFHAKVRGVTLDFGVSGLLYNSDVLLYDRATESLWSQLDRRAISGYYKGTRLQPIPMEQTSWRDWVNRHPDTQLLSRQTGFLRSYDSSPYAGYEQSSSLYFPVSFRAQGYHPKEPVLGVEIEGHFKAYPFSELSKSGSQLQDQVGGRQILIHFDIEHKSARVQDRHGNTLPTVVAFWFAWYAFHPDTQIYRADERE